MLELASSSDRSPGWFGLGDLPPCFTPCHRASLWLVLLVFIWFCPRGPSPGDGSLLAGIADARRLAGRGPAGKTHVAMAEERGVAPCAGHASFQPAGLLPDECATGSLSGPRHGFVPWFVLRFIGAQSPRGMLSGLGGSSALDGGHSLRIRGWNNRSGCAQAGTQRAIVLAAQNLRLLPRG